MAKLISQVYGEALFGLAVEENKLEQFSKELDAIEAVLLEYPEYSRILEHPQLDEPEKIQVFDRVFEGRICSELTGFFHILLEKGRFHDREAIIAYFQSKRLAHEKIGVACVKSAVELSLEQKKGLKTGCLQPQAMWRCRCIMKPHRS